MTSAHNALLLAAALNLPVTYHEASGTQQVQGHRIDRWYELRNVKEAAPLVIWRGGRSIVCSRSAYA